LLKIIIENQRALNDFIQQLTKMDGIERIETALVLDYIKLTTELSLE